MLPHKRALMTAYKRLKFCFVTSEQPSKTDATKHAIKETGVKDVLVFGVPAASGVREQPMGSETEYGAIIGSDAEQDVIGRIGNLDRIFNILRNRRSLMDDSGMPPDVQKVKAALVRQIEQYRQNGKLAPSLSTETVLKTLLSPEKCFAIFSFENGMFTLEEAEERKLPGNTVGFTNLTNAKLLKSEFIDVCVCAVQLPGFKNAIVSYDAGLPVHPDLSKYIHQAIGYNKAISNNGLPISKGVTATKEMMESGALQKFCTDHGWPQYQKDNGLPKFSDKDPHTPVSHVLHLYGPNSHKTRGTFLSEGVLPAFEAACKAAVSPDKAVIGKGVREFPGVDIARQRA